MSLFRKLNLSCSCSTPHTPPLKQGESETTLNPDLPSTRILRSTFPSCKCFKSCSPMSDLVSSYGPQATTRFTFTRRRAAVLALVQFHITGPSLHSVILCFRESFFLQRMQEFVSTRLMASNRSLVGIIPCIAAYHVDLIMLDTPAACNFVYTCAYGILGYFWVIHNSVFFCLYWPLFVALHIGVV